jgi:hypothetical protein
LSFQCCVAQASGAAGIIRSTKRQV